jgi:hypothetical protein
MKAVFPILTHRSRGTPGGWDQPAGSAPAADEKPPRDRRVKVFSTIWTVRGFLLVEIAIFLLLTSIHFDLLISGYRHRDAGATEVLIAAVMVAGLLLTWTPPPWNRCAAATAQYVGTLGALVGLFTVVLGTGHRTVLGLTLNGVLLLVLIAGLTSMRRNLRIAS